MAGRNPHLLDLCHIRINRIAPEDERFYNILDFCPFKNTY